MIEGQNFGPKVPEFRHQKRRFRKNGVLVNKWAFESITDESAIKSKYTSIEYIFCDKKGVWEKLNVADFGRVSDFVEKFIFDILFPSSKIAAP